MGTKEFTKKAITKQMEKVCLSGELANKTILCSLLEYLIGETLAGKEERLKGYTIGTEALGKGENFDPDKDPIVRIHAGRLRRTLRLYYLETGKNDAIRIEIPKGQYVPGFLANVDTTVEENNSRLKNNQPATEPSVAVIPFKNISGDPDKDYFGVGFAEELSIELTRFEDLIVYESVPFSANQISDVEIHSYLKNKGIRFIVEGSVQLTAEKIKVLVRLIDDKKGKPIWAEKYLRELSGNDLNEILENIISEISSVLGSEYGIIIQRLTSELTQAKPEKLDTFYAISRFHYFEARQTIDAAQEAFKSLELAITTDPGSGIAHAMLALLYGNRYLLDFPGADDAYKRMTFLAEKAMSLDPNSLGVRSIFTGFCFVSNKRDRFFQEAEICLSQNPRPSIRLGFLGYHLALYGDWDRGKEILDRVMKIKISFPLYYYGVTSLFYYRKGEYEKAHLELIKYNVPDLFWPYLQRAAVLGQLNRIDEAKPEIARLKQLKPDFEEKAEYLLTRFIREADLLALLLEGLRKAGMNV